MVDIALEGDYEVPISFSRRRMSDAASSSSSDSDFMDVSEMKPAIPDTIPVRFSDKTGTLFLPATNLSATERRNTSPADRSIHSISDIRRSVSFASCTKTSTRLVHPNEEAVWNHRYHNQPFNRSIQSNPSSVSHSQLYQPKAQSAPSPNPVGYVIAVTNENVTPKMPSFTSSNGRTNKLREKGKELKKSRTFNECDKNKINLIQRNFPQRTQTLQADLKANGPFQISPVTREPLQDQSRTSSDQLPIPSTRSSDRLRDSAVDLVSDEEDSEAYAAVSLAGTLSRNVPKIKSDKRRCGKRKLFIVIGVLSVFVAILVIVVVLLVVLKIK